MRISERERYKLTNNRVTDARQSNIDMLEKISTLKRINRLSDDPVGSSQVVRNRDRLANIEQFQQNIEFSKGYLEKSESAIKTLTDNLIRASELAVNQANGTYNSESRLAASKEIKQIMNEVVSQANTTYANRYVFSGFRTDTPTMASDGQFLGDDGAIFLQVDNDDHRQINLQARYLFDSDPDERAAGHFGIYETLDLLYQGLTSNDPVEIQKSLKELNFQLDKTTTFQASLGALYRALEAGGKKLESESDATKNRTANIEEVDMFKASSDFHRSESILQSTLLASNKLLQPSLLNFMQ